MKPSLYLQSGYNVSRITFKKCMVELPGKISKVDNPVRMARAIHRGTIVTKVSASSRALHYPNPQSYSRLSDDKKG